MSHPRSFAAGALAAGLLLAMPVTQLHPGTKSGSKPAPLIAPAFVSAADGRYAAPGPGGSQIGVAADRLVVAGSERSGMVRLLGADPRARAIPTARRPGLVNVYRRSRRSEGLRRYARVRYRGVWPGIDVVYHGLGDGLEYDFVLAPGADPERIALRRTGTLAQHAPRAFQDGREIPVRFVSDGGVTRVRLGAYDRRRPLLIDPTVIFSTYLGGTKDDGIVGVGTDASGNVLVAGTSNSPNFPTTPGTAQSSFGGTNNSDAVAAKFAPDGTLVWATYLGGSAIDTGKALAVAPDGSVVVTGGAGSGGFPTTPGSYQPNYMLVDPFLTKLSADGQMVWSTLFGHGTGLDGRAVALDAAGNVILVGGANPGFATETTPGAYRQSFAGGGSDGFVAKLSANGSSLLWSTLVGGAGDDTLTGVASAPDGSLWLTGGTSSTSFPVTPSAAQPTFGGGNFDALLARLSADGSALPYASFYGGSDTESAAAVAVDASGAAYVTGTTFSADLPVRDAAQPASGGYIDGFVAKVDESGALAWGSYVGGSGQEQMFGIAVGPDGGPQVAGISLSTDLPVTDGAPPSVAGALLASYAPGGRLRRLAVLNATGYGGASGVAVDASGAIAVAGSSVSPGGFPVTSGAAQATYGGGNSDGFVERLTLAPAADVAGADFGEVAVGASGDRTATVTNTGQAPLTIGSAALTGPAAGDYAIVSNGCAARVEPRASCAIGVRFTPTATGTRAATLDVATDAPGTPQHAALSGTGTAAPAPPPRTTPTPVPAPTPDPPLVLRCAGLPVVLLDVHEQGGRVSVGGIALARYAGQRVTIRPSRGAGSARAVVQADGSFAATLPVPKASDYRRVVYGATLAGRRSPRLHLYRNFVVTSSRVTATRLQVTAKVLGGRRGTQATLRRQVSCQKTVATRTIRIGARGVLKLTLPRPAAGKGFVFYRVITKVRGFRTFTLPIAVPARAR